MPDGMFRGVKVSTSDIEGHLIGTGIEKDKRKSLDLIIEIQ